MKGFLSCERFDTKAFSDPELEYAPIYSWMWDDVVSEDLTDRRLEEMVRLGVKRFYILPIPKEFRGKSLHSEMSPEYLSDEYMRQYRYAVKRASELGMQVWLYDEGGWPSGGACGRVLAENDAFAKESVECVIYTLHKGNPYSPDKTVIAAFAEGRRIYSGFIGERDLLVDEYKRKIGLYQGTSEVSDVTKCEATDAFLRLTHEKYKGFLGDEFGKTITAVFTDEPTGPRPFPYREKLSYEFYKLYSVYIEDYLPILFGREPVTDESVDVILNWYDFCSKCFCENYLKKEKTFCTSHDVAFLGHMDKDDESDGSIRGGSYHIMRALRTLDVPGIDVIHRQIYPNRAKVESSQRTRKDGKFIVDKANKFFPRLASSAAAQIGGRHALTESFAVYGNGLTFDEMRYVLNFQAIRGINVFNLMALSYGESSTQRAGILPHFSDKNGCYRDLSTFNSYCSRLSYLASLGRRSVDVALYYPIRDSFVRDSYPPVAVNFEEVGVALEKLHVDFDLFDDDVISSASESDLDKGVIRLGLAEYRTLIFPYCRYASPQTLDKVARFISGGGRVLTIRSDIGVLPIRGADAVKLSDLGRFVAPAVDFVGESADFSAATLLLENGEMHLVLNESQVPSTCTIRLSNKNNYLIRDISLGEIREISSEEGSLTLSLASGEMVSIFETDDEIKCSLCEKFREVGEISEWTLRPIEKMSIGDKDTEIVKIAAPAFDVELGDWRTYVGEDFSGTCLYEANFDWNFSSDCILDLGDVKYACAIEVNEHRLEPRVMRPYRWRIPVHFLRSSNRLSIRVTNSSANAFLHTAAFDENASSYYGIEKEYLADSLAGGLLGKVKLFTE